MSDTTHLTNFSSDEKAWSVYMTIGNLSASARMATAMHSLLFVALLLIAIKMRDIPLSRYNEQKEHNRMILQHVLRHILGPSIRVDRRVFFAWCVDGHFRHCLASPATWIADYPEHRNLHNIKNSVCYWCKCPKAEMGQLPVRPYPMHDHNKYRALSVANTATANTRLASFDVHQGSNVFWDLDCVTSNLPKPDLLHTMQLGMLKHLLGWLSVFLKHISTSKRSTISGFLYLCILTWHNPGGHTRRCQAGRGRNQNHVAFPCRRLTLRSTCCICYSA